MEKGLKKVFSAMGAVFCAVIFEFEEDSVGSVVVLEAEAVPERSE